MQRVAGLIAHRAALTIQKPERAIGGHKRILDDDTARAGALHSDHIPVVDDFELIAIEENPGVAERSFGLGIPHHGGPEEMRRKIASGGVIPGAADAKTAIGENPGAARHADAGCAEVARGAEDLALRVFG
jgi:hypothetical protein